MRQTLRWGIVGTGHIARTVAADIQLCRHAVVEAVASRTTERAREFSRQVESRRFWGSYRELFEDPDIDVVYVATPHVQHAQNTIDALRCGKHVLVEKPFAMNAAEASRMIRAAKQSGRFLMEAMWTRFLPAMVKLRSLIDQGSIGRPILVEADFGFQAPADPRGRLLNPDLGGGALLDVGIYPLSFASMVLGKATGWHTHAQLGKTGVDLWNTSLVEYRGGARAQLCSSISLPTPQRASVSGTHGWICVHRPFWACRSLTVQTRRGGCLDLDQPYRGKGYVHEIEAVTRCIRNGETESSVMPLSESRALVTLMDSLRSRWGLRYPGEAA